MPVFLFTDIEGSTRLWEEHTAEMGAVIARHDALLQQEVTASGGRITKHTGDGITAAFEAGEPLACALETQTRFACEAWGAIGELCIRVGLHAGAAEWIAGVEGQAGDYFGPPVNCAARIMSAAWGGQILLTPEVSRASHLPPGASLKDLGQHLLKDVGSPQQIYQLVHPDLPRQAFPPPRTLSGQSIWQAVNQRGVQMAHLASSEMAMALLSATLLPALQGELDPESGALEGNLGVLESLGALSLRSFLAAFAQRLRAGAGPSPRERMPAAELQVLLQDELQAQWQAGGETALALRSDASRLLQAVHGVEAAMMAASAEVKQALARGLAGLGSQFDEFRWVLADVQETLAEVRGWQRAQFDLQQLQLARTEELLALHRGPGRPFVPAAAEAPLVEARRPAFLEEGAPDLGHRPVFVARERELAWLQDRLDAALVGQGGVVFVTGGPGRGKTALLDEFARRAMDEHDELLAASGTCDAYSGVGDPYLPFREVLGMLSGEVEARWAAGAISRDHALRLWQALPAAVEALLAHGPHVVPALVPGEALLARASAAGPAQPWLARLRERVAQGPGPAEGLEQGHLFQQVSNVLHALAQVHPLLLILDDLQWADSASLGLLFHLGRRLAGSRVLIAAAYRPEEVALDQEAERHPLEKVVVELKRHFGDIVVGLGRAEQVEGREFVDAYLATEPNQLGDEFRQALFSHTEGHPLFTVELLRAMQERGDLIRDQVGRWMVGPTLSWDALPVRVEAVIEERIGRLSEDLRDTLLVASVEGEEFTAQVVARVRELQERRLLRALTQELVKRHRLVREQGEDRVGRRVLSRYRFAHALFQHYLYNGLGAGERRLLHGEIAEALADLFKDRRDKIAVQLAFHYCQAGAEEKALPYLLQAGHQARSGFAHAEAIRYYTQALAILEEDDPSCFDLLAARAAVYDISAQRAEQKADVEAMLALAQDQGDEIRRCDALLALADYYRQTEHLKVLDPAQEALEIAESLGDRVRQAQALRRLGSLNRSQGDYRSSRAQLERAIELFEQADLSVEVARCLHILSLTLSDLGGTEAAMQAAEKSVALSRKAGDRRQEAVGLRRLAAAHGPQPRPQASYEEALLHVERALALHRELGDRWGECNALNVLGVSKALGGDYVASERDFRLSLEIAESIDYSIGILFPINNLGYYQYFRRGEFQAYLVFLEESMARAVDREDEWLVGSLLNLKGVTLAALGQFQAARSALERSLGIIDRVGSGGEEARLRLDLAFVYTCLADYARARRDLHLAAAIARKTGDGSLLRETLFSEARIALREGNLETVQAGLELVKEGLATASERERANQRTGYDVGARLHLALGDVEQAEQCSRRAVDLIEEPAARRNPEEVWLTHSRVLRAKGHEAEADGYLRRAYDRVMLVASKTTDPELKQSWLENVPDNREIVAQWEARQKRA